MIRFIRFLRICSVLRAFWIDHVLIFRNSSLFYIRFFIFLAFLYSKKLWKCSHVKKSSFTCFLGWPVISQQIGAVKLFRKLHLLWNDGGAFLGHLIVPPLFKMVRKLNWCSWWYFQEALKVLFITYFNVLMIMLIVKLESKNTR